VHYRVVGLRPKPLFEGKPSLQPKIPPYRCACGREFGNRPDLDDHRRRYAHDGTGRLRR
jgi:hypothetical protein